ncbi:MAG: hypothetical protein QMB23_01670, partial [Candidatus Nanopelagicales bacterium]
MQIGLPDGANAFRYGEGMQLMSDSVGSAPGAVALVFGGRSPEHSISCLSAKSVLAALLELGYKVLCIGITSDGTWVEVSPCEVESYEITANHYPEVANSDRVIRLVMNAYAPGIAIDGEFRPISVLFPVLH